ncbi:MAG: site-specific integrase [Peptococcaceae bacterium]|nr:site-specific integrase [Peptococcaceae bacterium]
MATFVKILNKNGRVKAWQAQIYLGYDERGKQVKKYVNRPTQKEAREAAKALEKKYGSNKNYGTLKMKFGDYADEWIALNRSRLAPSTVVLYVGYVKNHFKPAFGSMRLDQITELHIRRWMARKLETHVQNTARKLFFILREMLHDVLKDGTPCKDIQPPPKGKHKPYIPTEEEFEKMRKDVKGTKYEIIILLAAWCGLRRGEIFALEWNDINWANGTIKIDEALSISEGEGYVAKDPKSDNGFRGIAVPDELMALLQEWRSKQKVIKKRIFSGRPDNFSSTFIELREQYRWPPSRFHDLRHYHASWMYNKGIPDHYAAQRLGHDIQTLKSIYQHIGLEQKADLDSQIKGLFATKEQNKNRTDTENSF